MEFPGKRPGKKSTALEKEWAALKKSEARFVERQKEKGPSIINQKLDRVVPEKLKGTLDAAFYKAFQLVFEKGGTVINKTYRKEDGEYRQKLNAYAVGLKENRKNLKAFSKQAGVSKTKNLLISGVEGIGTGVFGIGIPDIPLFTGVILKSLYEIAVSYGYAYESEREQEFLLEIIKTALERGGELAEDNERINRWIEGTGGLEEKKVLMRKTADRLSEELLYMKFVQGLPIIGIAGGLSDCVYLKRITDYAELKYRRRFLQDRYAAKGGAGNGG